MRGVITALAWLLMASVPRCETVAGPPGATYPARVTRVVDGDTLEAEVGLWPTIVARVTVRLVGIDTPELRGKCEAERTRAAEARVALGVLVGAGQVYVRDPSVDLYRGRIDARVLLPNGGDVGAALIAAGHARPYDGTRHRAGWCGREDVPP